MGVNYRQDCLVGIRVEEDSMRVVISPAKYEDQPRYNTNTGKITHYENVLVKKEEVRLMYTDFTFNGNSICDFAKGLESHLNNEKEDIEIRVEAPAEYMDDDCIWIGIYIGDNKDMGNVDLREGEESLKDLGEKAIAVADALDVDLDEIGIHFIPYVG